MKKILLAFEGTHFSDGAFEFARRLNELRPILLTGVFLPQTELANLWSYVDPVGVPFVPTIETEEGEIVYQNIARFERLCTGNNIDFRVHNDFYGLALAEIKKESRFADLLIIGSEVFYKNTGIKASYSYLKELLHDIACPVLIVPEKFDFPNSIILAYDGSEESVYAIKQFAYLFPELTENQTLLVYANEDDDKDFPDKFQIEELVIRHYSNLTLFKLDVNPRKYFKLWISEEKSAILVSGSYGHSGVSHLFKRSFVKDIITDQKLPVFIAHK
jgi:nucleotide-binding universal stress UspA family protein